MAGCKVIGILGGVGSGKTIVTDYLKNKYKAYVIRADEIAHRLYKKGQPGYQAIIRICGKSVLDENRQIDRRKLGNIIYNNPEKPGEVNSAIHPMVYRKTAELIREYDRIHHHRLVVYEAALIPYSCPDIADEFWYIYTPADIRAQRLHNDRGYDFERISDIIGIQPSDEEYREFCDRIIINDGTFEKLEEQIDEIIKYSKRKQR